MRMRGLVGNHVEWSEATFLYTCITNRDERASPHFDWEHHRGLCMVKPTRGWHCDNQAVVSCLQSRTSRHPTLMHLRRNLVYVEARSGFYLYLVYIDTHANHLTDDLSRTRVSSFFLKVLQASLAQDRVPAELVDLLLDHQADWTSQQ